MWDLNLRPKLGTSRLRGPEHLTGPSDDGAFTPAVTSGCKCYVCFFFVFSDLFYLFVPLLVVPDSMNAPSCPTRPSRKKTKNNSHQSTHHLQSSNCSRRLFMSCIQESRKLFDSIERILHAQYRGRGERQKKTTKKRLPAFARADSGRQTE